MPRPFKSLPRTPEIDALVESNTGLAYLAANRAWGRGGHVGVSLEEVVSASLHTLWKCAVRYDPDRGCKFSTLAYQSCFRRARQTIQFERIRKKVIRAVPL